MFTFLAHSALIVIFIAAVILAAVLYYSVTARAKAKLIAQQDLEAAQAEAAKIGAAVVADVIKVEAKL